MIDGDRINRYLTRSAEGIEAVEEQLRRLRALTEESLAEQQKQSDEMRTQSLIAYLNAGGAEMPSGERLELEARIRDRLGI